MAKSTITKAYDILKTYDGFNNQIKYYKRLYEAGKLILEDFSSQYIVKNYDYEPIHVNKAVKISSEFGKTLMDKFNLSVIPKMVYISTIIGEMGGSYHCYIKSKTAGNSLIYIKKRYILDKLVDVDYMSLDIDFSVYDNMPSNQGRKLKEHQKTGVKFLVGNKKAILADSMGTGKEQPVSSFIVTPNGYKRMGDMHIGDEVMSSNGGSCTVVGVFPQGVKDVYEITFSDGVKCRCGLDHLWRVQNKNWRDKRWEVKSLKELLELGLYDNISEMSKQNGLKPLNKWSIPMAEPLVFTEKDFYIHPYVLGICISDGYFKNGVGISIPDTEIEIADRIQSYLKDGYHLTRYETESCPQYIIKNQSETNIHKYFQEIKRLGIGVTSQFKFIPSEYKLGSVQQRLDLLRGLMDSDGSITVRNKIRYSTKSQQLADDVCELIWSLGGQARKLVNDRGDKGIEYNVSIQLMTNPFYLKRKADKYNSPLKKYCIRKIQDVKLVCQEECQCIKVDSDDHTYLTGKECIVTHNTTTSIIAALAGGYKKILIITTASLKSGWRKDLVLYEDEKNISIVNGSTWEPGKKFTIINYDIVTNFYEVPMEPDYRFEDVVGANGNVVETLRVPIMVKDKSTGKMVPKMKKSRKKEDIQRSLSNSQLFLENYDCVIIDEAQKLSNKGSNRYNAISDFLIKANPKAIYLLSGTPLTNNPMNLYNILKLIDADVTHDYRYYKTRYCGEIEHTKRDGGKYWTKGGEMHLDELRDKIKDVYIRRLASETGNMVGKSIIRKYYDLTPEQSEKYNKLWDEYMMAQNSASDMRNDTEQYRQLIEGGLVRQFLAKEMVPHTIELTDEYLEQNEKVVIMTCYREEMDMLKQYYGKQCVLYNGSMTTKQKDKAQDEFMNNPNIKVFIGQVIAAGVGLSIPISKTLIFNSYDWVAANNKQSEDRIYRLTQTRDVECIYQLFTDSISQDMFDKVIYKELLMNSTIKSEKEKMQTNGN